MFLDSDLKSRSTLEWVPPFLSHNLDLNRSVSKSRSRPSFFSDNRSTFSLPLRFANISTLRILMKENPYDRPISTRVLAVYEAQER
jgi:SET domain-containing protein